jgi:hypothetical protein
LKTTDISQNEGSGEISLMVDDDGSPKCSGGNIGSALKKRQIGSSIL